MIWRGAPARRQCDWRRQLTELSKTTSSVGLHIVCKRSSPLALCFKVAVHTMAADAKALLFPKLERQANDAVNGRDLSIEDRLSPLFTAHPHTSSYLLSVQIPVWCAGHSGSSSGEAVFGPEQSHSGHSCSREPLLSAKEPAPPSRTSSLDMWGYGSESFIHT